MKASAEVAVTVLLELTEREAAFMMDVFQNPVTPTETPGNEKVRKEIFMGLRGAIDELQERGL